MKENSKLNSGNSLSPLVAHNRVIGTVELLVMLLTSLEHLLLMSLLKIILKRLINLLLETLYTSVLFLLVFEFLYSMMGQPHAKNKLFPTSIVFWIIKVCCRIVEHYTFNP